MPLAPSALRMALRNRLAGRSTLVVALLATCAAAMSNVACAAIAGLEDPAPTKSSGPAKPGSAGGGGGSSDVGTLPVDPTLPASPSTACGDVSSSATNCGFCGHSCRGDACGNGLCAASLVVSTSTVIDAFTTDGDDLFYIDAQSARVCTKGGNPSDCREIITVDEVGRRLDDLKSEDEHFTWGTGWGWSGKKGGNNNTLTVEKLAPKAITLSQGRVYVADDSYHSILACPAKGTCDHTNVALVDADTGNSSTMPFGRTISVSTTDIAWTQGGSLLRATPIPQNAAMTPAKNVVGRAAADTTQTTRVLVPDVADVFWLSGDGLHHAPDVIATSEKWFSATSAHDFHASSTAVYVSTDKGVYRIERANPQNATAATQGSAYTHVAVDDHGVYATKQTGPNVTTIVELRAGGPLPIAVVNGEVRGITLTPDYLYFATIVAGGSEIRRVSR